ncbi:acyl-[acyl-carrier-protein]--UDP-N-acetylglucosamine O-acyltransferase [Tistlia consotensis]|uniref:Acyl-[acyl-carrier-protein]--UDP-N-acetylglucosamine O-acyltransferase n=1 Tax=Tistlia consotensis USBA 355 TaxID=560819 RepID=A0A1Y6CQA8_9PROT|nr:acyl-ACP--UDP-N-acetylglucosamine O-acyltransferase [Tistlia consotensis]SMF70570.1 acyl-[acyl-carrier-protein]--UDP-N-acetylglucosamine O-acyltransferase [Tistlia consotensis USBA 355]SNS04711.1 acyl-[acyl-carrier-protein]--UDP-N-acetylglucosamine O-acyltransferase [Tistlia consotensis]
MTAIHPTAIVEAGARLGEGVEIGPFCLVGPEVELGDRVKLYSHVVVTGHTSVGAGTRIFPFASIGHPPQDLKYAGEASRLEIGRDNIVREQVTMNPGTEGGGLLTKVGDGCLFMVGAHVAHDCRVGDRVILANNATLAGHVQVGDQAIVGGLSAIHQFVRIGAHAMIGGMSGIEHDVIPYGLAMGDRARLSGLNLVGLKRRGYSRAEIQGLMAAYERLFDGEGTLVERVARVAESYNAFDTVRDLVAFVQADSSRALCQPRAGHGGR